MIDTTNQAPVELERARYVARLIKMDWQFEHAEGNAYRAGRQELNALKDLRARLDPKCELWNRYVPRIYQADNEIRSFLDFAGRAAVTVEWSLVNGTPRILAVVTSGGGDVFQALSPAVLDDYQRKAQAILDQAAALPLDPLSAFRAPEVPA